MENPVQKKNYNAIDAVRIVVAAMTVAAHAWFLGNENSTGITRILYWVLYQYLGRLGIPFFIVTAGYFYFRKLPLSEFSFRNAVLSLKRYLHLYIVWTLIYFPLAYVDFFEHPKGVRHAVIGYIRNIIFTGDNLHLWFLNTLIFALFLVSFLLYKGVKPSRIPVIAAFFYLIGMFGQAWFGFLVPLTERAPVVRNILKLCKTVIVTTRNGLMYGFLFAAMGMCFAYYGVRVPRKKAAAGFLLSVVSMGIEIMVFQRRGFFLEHDMTISLIPATYFLFSILLQIKLPDSPVYGTLRKISALVYFSHMWVLRIITVSCRRIGRPVPQSFLLFVLALGGSAALSCLIIRLSGREGFRWLKTLY